MPLRFYDNNDWRTPTEVRVYDGTDFKNVEVGYVYDSGVWRVVFPDPITPSISILDTFSGKDYDTNELYIGATISVLNGNDDTITAELFSGSTATGTPLSTLTFTPTSVSGNTAVYEPTFYSVSFANGTYCIRITATSVTNNSSTITTSPIILAIPTVSISSYSVTWTTSFSVTWSSTNQYRWRVSIINPSGGTAFSSNNGNWTVSNATTFSSSINPALLGNTQYYILVEVENNNFDSAEATQYFTTDDFPTPIVNITNINSTCGSIYVEWTAQNATYGNAKIYDVYFGTPQFPETVYTEIVSKRITWTTGRNHTFTGLSSSTNYLVEIIGYNELDVAGPVSNSLLSTTSASAPNAPSNLSASSNYNGNAATLTWTTPQTNCASITGYTVQYKLTSSSTWTTASSSVASTATSYTTGAILSPNRSYNFKVIVKSALGNNESIVTFTMPNNPSGISLSASPSGIITTFSTVTLTAQLINSIGESVTNSGVSLAFSATANRGTFSSTSGSTNTSGRLVVSYTTNETIGYIDFLVGVPENLPNPGISNGSTTVPVTLSNALNPILTSTRTNFGYIVTHSNYNSSWSYTGTVDNGGFNFDGVWNDGSYDIVIPPINTAFPVASRNALVSVTCTSGTWTAQPSATTRVTSTRLGYFAGVGVVTNSPTGTLSFSYTWYFGNGAVAGSGQTLSITSAMRGRNMYCIVIATRTGGTQGFQAQSNTISIPA